MDPPYSCRVRLFTGATASSSAAGCPPQPLLVGEAVPPLLARHALVAVCPLYRLLAGPAGVVPVSVLSLAGTTTADASLLSDDWHWTSDVFTFNSK